jgi:hypothetical protein
LRAAAQLAGLKPGEIITKINGVIARDPNTAVALVSENAAGERIWLTVIDGTGGRNHQSNVFATLAAHPPGRFASIMTAKARPPHGPCRFHQGTAALHPVPLSNKHCPGRSG